MDRGLNFRNTVKTDEETEAQSGHTIWLRPCRKVVAEQLWESNTLNLGPRCPPSPTAPRVALGEEVLSLPSFTQDNGSRLDVEKRKDGEIKRNGKKPSAFTFTCVLFQSALFAAFS